MLANKVVQICNSIADLYNLCSKTSAGAYVSWKHLERIPD